MTVGAARPSRPWTTPPGSKTSMTRGPLSGPFFRYCCHTIADVTRDALKMRAILSLAYRLLLFCIYRLRYSAAFLSVTIPCSLCNKL